MTETRAGMTAGELLGLPDEGKRRELVEGELKETAPAGARHGSVAMRLASRLDRHMETNRLGVVLAAADLLAMRATYSRSNADRKMPPESVLCDSITA